MQGHRDLQTIPVGHEQVRYHESGGSPSELAEPFLTIGRIGDHIPSRFQHLPKEGTDLLVVVNDENRTMIYFEVLQDVVAASRAMEAPATLKGLDC